MYKNQGITDDEIISKCKHGSLKYQELLYKRFHGYAMGVALRYVLNREDALETVNDAFIKIFNSINGFESGRPFKAWLNTITVRTAIDRRRKELKFTFYESIENAPMLNVFAAAIETLNAKDIMIMLQLLPAIQSTIFNLHEIDGYSHDEIAAMLGIPASSSRVYLTRARERMRKLLTTEALRYGK